MARGRGVRGRYRWLSPGERAAVRARFGAGALVEEVMAEFGLPARSAYRVRDEVVLLRRRVEHSPHRLCFEERERIVIGIARGESNAQIARALGRHRSTIGREIARCGRRRHHYRALRGERLAQAGARRPKATKLSGDPRLLGWVTQRLSERLSPEQISARLRIEFPDDPGMRISHETIYQSLFVQGRGELRRELTRCLRSGRTKRKPQGRVERRGQIPGMVMISERPAEAADRAVPGHWEGDLLIGKAQRSQVATLVERSTRFVMLAALSDRTAEHVATVLAERISTLPERLRRSLTWDQGRELSEHHAFSLATGVPVFFCDPRSPWQRGSNENTNGLLRQYLPHGLDLSTHSQDQLDAIADELNRRPRKTLGWLTPAEKMLELVGPTAPGSGRPTAPRADPDPGLSDPNEHPEN